MSEFRSRGGPGSSDLLSSFGSLTERPIFIAASRMPAVTEQERELAQQATTEFERGNYDACLNALGKLSTSRDNDPKLAHNKAVASFYKSGFKNTDEFKQAMEVVCAKVHVNVDNIAALEDVDQCVLYFNHAVLLYHTRHYHSALTIMDKLFQYVEPVTLQRKAMFLLIELLLCTQQPERAMGIVAYMEKVMFGNGKSQHSPEKEENKVAAALNKDDTPNINDVWKPRISMYKARCYMMLKSMKSCKREMKSLMGVIGMNTPLVYLKSNFEYLRCNYRKAIKVLNSAPQSLKSVANTGESLPTMYYNNMGVIHFYMRKHNLGAFYFRKALHENQVCSAEFNKAQYGKSLSGRPIQTVGISRHYELMYNMGTQLLHCGQPKAAFECLIQTTALYELNPRLWLRLTECCIMAYKANNDEDRKLSSRLGVVQGSVGSGVHRKLILGPGVELHNSLSYDSPAIPAPTLEFASLCLRNALMLLPEDPLNVPPPAPDDASETRPAHENSYMPAPPANPMRNCEVANLRCSILAASAYVALCLNDQIVALHHAENLLKQPRLSGAQRYCGHLYKAEALVALDRIADAVAHLNPDNVTDIGTVPPEPKTTDQDKNDKNGDRDSQEITEAKGALYPWSPRDLPRAKAIMQYNLATAHTVRGEYEKALMHLSKSTQTIGLPLPAQMYYLKLYLEFMEGHRKVAQGIIKEHFGHVTPNRV